MVSVCLRLALLRFKKERESPVLPLEASEVIKSGPDEDGKSSAIVGAFVPVNCTSLAAT